MSDIDVSHPASEPPGFTTQSNWQMTNNGAYSGWAFIDKDELLFKFYNFYADVKININLVDDAGNGPLADDEIIVERNEGDHFVLFKGFPPNRAGDETKTCKYKLNLTNVTKESSSTQVDLRIFRRQ